MIARRVGEVEAWVTAGRVRVTAAVCLACAVGVTAVWLATSAGGIDRFGQPVGGDFVLFHAAARLALAGRAADAFAPDLFLAAQRLSVPGTPPGLLWCYPPPFQLLLAPLGALPFAAACALWTALGVGAWLAALRGIVGPGRPLWIALALPAVVVTAWQGQTSFFVAAALGVGLFQLDRRPWLAGAALGLLVCKPQFGVLVPLLLAGAGRWRPLLAAGVSAGGLCLLSLAVFGPGLWMLFLHDLPSVGRGVSEGLLPWTKIPSVFEALLRLGVAPGPALAGHAAVAAGVAALTLAAWRRPGPLEAKAGLAALAAVVVTPYGFNYDLVILSLPLAAAAALAARGRLPTGVTAALAPLVLLPSLMIGLAEATGVQWAPLFLLAGLWGAWRLARDVAPSREADAPAGAAPSAAG